MWSCDSWSLPHPHHVMWLSHGHTHLAMREGIYHQKQLWVERKRRGKLLRTAHDVASAASSSETEIQIFYKSIQSPLVFPACHPHHWAWIMKGEYLQSLLERAWLRMVGTGSWTVTFLWFPNIGLHHCCTASENALPSWWCEWRMGDWEQW